MWILRWCFIFCTFLWYYFISFYQPLAVPGHLYSCYKSFAKPRVGVGVFSSTLSLPRCATNFTYYHDPHKSYTGILYCATFDFCIDELIHLFSHAFETSASQCHQSLKHTCIHRHYLSPSLLHSSLTHSFTDSLTHSIQKQSPVILLLVQ